MVYLEPVTLGWRPLVKSWLQVFPEVYGEDCKELTHAMFEWLVDPCLDFVRKSCREYSPAGQANQVSSMMHLVDMLMHEAITKDDAADNKHLRIWLTSAIMFAVPWALAGCVDNDSRKKFDAFYRDLMACKFDDSPLPKEVGKLELPFPAENTTYDFYFEVSDGLKDRGVGGGDWRMGVGKERGQDVTIEHGTSFL
ncbi:dynein axonemal heavy chain 3-like [Littorina saxatilis]|uniref:dynein axonemal heavy chain 3-like n=1 Tax=Littorina saxatilis TaxID=31220 RepID=UPI0038B6A544